MDSNIDMEIEEQLKAEIIELLRQDNIEQERKLREEIIKLLKEDDERQMLSNEVYQRTQFNLNELANISAIEKNDV